MKAARDLVPGVRVYVIGGVAEGRTAVLSDIDILIIIPGNVAINKSKLYKDILTRSMDCYGLPWDAPVELHIAYEDEAKEYLKSKAIEVT
ncbi:MAG: nucleotidyltransferase domain-containing protein [Thermoproteus sp.]